MDRFIYQECKEITKSLLNRLICRPFWTVDKNDEFYSIVKNPLSLEDVRARLKRNEYRRMEEWLSDINLIWENAFTLFSENDMEYLVALDMKQWVYERLALIPQKPSGEWISSLKKVSISLCETTK